MVIASAIAFSNAGERGSYCATAQAQRIDAAISNTRFRPSSMSGECIISSCIRYANPLFTLWIRVRLNVRSCVATAYSGGYWNASAATRANFRRRHRKTKRLLLFVVVVCVYSAAQNSAAQNPRVFITDSHSWAVGGSSGGSSEGFGGHVSGGARPQTAEIIKTFGERCPNVTINSKPEKADYAVVLDHEGGKSLILRDNKVAVVNRDGDAILSASTRSLGNAVTNACQAITKDWSSKGPRAADPQPAAASASTPAPQTVTKVQIVSQPAGADIEIDGNFVGSTPSTVSLSTGDHVITVKKTGYKNWERKIKITGGRS